MSLSNDCILSQSSNLSLGPSLDPRLPLAALILLPHPHSILFFDACGPRHARGLQESLSHHARRVQQNTAWIKELDHGCADGLRELDERMAKLEKTLERMEDWAEQVGKHLGRRLEPG